MTDKAAGERTAGAELREAIEALPRYNERANAFVKLEDVLVLVNRAALRSQPEGKEQTDGD